jgi:hypothetical protein
VYKAVLRDTGEEVAVKVQRPGIEPLILRDLYVFRALGSLFNAFSQQRLGCNAELVVDEFGEKLLEELDYMQVGYQWPLCTCSLMSASADELCFICAQSVKPCVDTFWGGGAAGGAGCYLPTCM